jgi:uroporphyrinogen-III decarboxylase
VPNPAAEGGYNSRLSVIKDLPKGNTIWMFDATDMAKAKATVGDTLCMMGNVPSTLLNLGSPKEVKEYSKKLIEVAGKNGGFVLSNGAFFDQAKPENLKAVVEAAQEFGAYK